MNECTGINYDTETRYLLILSFRVTKKVSIADDSVY